MIYLTYTKTNVPQFAYDYQIDTDYIIRPLSRQYCSPCRLNNQFSCLRILSLFHNIVRCVIFLLYEKCHLLMHRFYIGYYLCLEHRQQMCAYLQKSIYLFYTNCNIVHKLQHIISLQEKHENIFSIVKYASVNILKNDYFLFSKKKKSKIILNHRLLIYR